MSVDESVYNAQHFLIIEVKSLKFESHFCAG